MRDNIPKSEVEQLIICMKNIEPSVQAASGLAVAVEMRMRLIGQFSDLVRKKLVTLVKHGKVQIPKGRKSSSYLKCDLQFLDKALADVFSKELSSSEHADLLEFRDLRNDLLHAKFVDLMKGLDIKPTGREIIVPSRDRNILASNDIEEAFKSIETNQGFQKFCEKAKNVIRILDDILRRVAI